MRLARHRRCFAYAAQQVGLPSRSVSAAPPHLFSASLRHTVSSCAQQTACWASESTGNLASYVERQSAACLHELSQALCARQREQVAHGQRACHAKQTLLRQVIQGSHHNERRAFFLDWLCCCGIKRPTGARHSNCQAASFPPHHCETSRGLWPSQVQGSCKF